MPIEPFRLLGDAGPDLGLRLLLMGHCRLGAESWRFDRVSSPYHRLYLVTDGQGEMRSAHETIPLVRDRIYFIPAGAVYSYRCAPFIEKCYFHFRLDYFPGNDALAAITHCRHWPADTTDQVPRLVAAARRGHLGDHLAVRSEVLGLLAKLADGLGGPGERDRLLASKYQPLFQHVDLHLTLQTSIADLARLMGRTPATLAAAFKRDTGQALKAYLQAQLALKAKAALLRYPSVREAARELGFDNEFYFSRFFKRQTGLAPSAYQARAMREVAEPSPEGRGRQGEASVDGKQAAVARKEASR